MATIPGINERAPQRPVFVNHLDELVKGQGLSEKSIHLVKEVAGLLGAESSVRVSNKPAGIQNAQVGAPNGPTGVPALDNPDDVKAKEVDLERLISYLQLETDKHQAELAKDRIELQKNEMEARHAEQKEKLQKSLNEMEKAAASSNFSRIFGWLMAAAAVVFAVVACVATGGLAAGPLIGAGIALTMCVLNETGVTQMATEKLASALENLGMSKMAAQIASSVAIAAIMIAVALGTGSIGGLSSAGSTAATSTVQAMAQSARSTLDIGVKLMGVVAVGAGGYAAYRGYEAGYAQADVSESEKFLAMMRQQLEESQEEMQAILDRIQQLYSDIISILGSESDTQAEIARQIGQMA